MKSENVKLLNESAIRIESHQKIIVANPQGIKQQYIGDKDSFLAIQHYTNGLMDEIILNL